MSVRTVLPDGWPSPRGYANGTIGRGEVLFVAGQIGWDPQGRAVSDAFVPQFERALQNVVAVVHAAGGRVEDIARMTVYVTDLDAYRHAGKALGAAWRGVMGTHYPAMALVGVTGLVEPWAKVEIEADAMLGGDE